MPWPPPYLPQMTGVTQVTFLQPLPQLLHRMDICPSPGIGPGRNLAGEGDFALAYKPCLCIEEAIGGGGRGESVSWTCLHSIINSCPSRSFTNRRAACLSGPQGTLDDYLESPPYSCSLPQWFWGHITSVWGPPLNFPNLVPEDLNLLESCVFRYHVRFMLPTSCGCCGIDGCNFLLRSQCPLQC